jgi:membrane-associated phospholipid phosphatase
VNTDWFIVAAVGVGVFLLSLRSAVHDTIPRWEMVVFRAVNRLPGFLYYLLWPPMQLGNLVVGCVAGLALAWGAGAWDVAVGVVLATVLKLVVERLVRRLVHGHIPARVRPGTSQPGAVLRGGDVPSSGPSFPSGHVLLISAIACVAAPALPAWWELVPGVAAVLVMVGRVYVGAHNPLDVTAGMGIGMALGGVVAAFVQR